MTTKTISLEKKIVAYFFIVVVIITVVLVISYRINKQNKEGRQWVAETEQRVTQITSTEVMLKDMVNESRAYIITGAPQFLNSADQLSTQVRDSIGKLENAFSSSQKESKVQLSKHLNVFESKRAKLVEAKQEKQVTAARLTALLIESNNALSALHQSLERLKENELALLQVRKDAYQNSVRRAALIVRVLLLAFVASLFAAFFIIYRAIRTRNKAEVALIKSKTLLDNIISHAPVLVSIKDLEGRFILTNLQFAQALQTTQEQLLGNTSDNFLDAQTAEKLAREDAEVLRSQKTSDLQITLSAPDGPHTYIASKFPLFDDKGKLYAIGSTSADITPVIAAHKALEESYELQQKYLNGLQQVLGSSSDLICVIDENGVLLQISDSSQTLFGYAPKEMMYKKFMDFVVEEDKETTLAIFAEIKKGKSIFDFTNHYKTKSGATMPVIWSATWVEEDHLAYCVARNGTTQKLTAEKLAQSQTSLLNAQRIARLGSWEWDIKNDRLSGSDEFYQLLKIEKDTSINFESLLKNWIHPDDRNPVSTAIKNALLKGTRIDLEHRIFQSDGTLCYMRSIGEVRLDANNTPSWLSGTMQDISARKNSEKMLERLNERLEKRAQELQASNAELEQFAYVASHDLQEPLRMVSSFLTLLKNRLDDKLDEAGKQYIYFAIDGAERMKQLIQDLLQYSRVASNKETNTPVDLNEVLESTLRTFRPLIAETGAEIKSVQLPIVHGNKTQLGQVLQNLMSNALKYIDGRQPVIEINTENKEDYWQISLKDNGIGIDPKFHDKIFTIFQRLHGKKEYGGTGIGLAIAKKVIERHGGKIWLQSEAGNGTTFFFTIKKNPNE